MLAGAKVNWNFHLSAGRLQPFVKAGYGLSRREILSDQEETGLRRSHVGLEFIVSF